MYFDRPGGSTRFRQVKAPTNAELTQLAHTIASRVGRYLERQGLLERDADDCMDAVACARGISASMYVIACIEDPQVVKKILDHLRDKAEIPAHTLLPESRAASRGAYIRKKMGGYWALEIAEQTEI